MSFAERIKLWKGQIATSRNLIDKAHDDFEEIAIDIEQKDVMKLYKSVREKRMASIELIGTIIAQLKDFAPITANALEGHLEKTQKLEKEYTELLDQAGGLIWWVKNKKKLAEQTNSINTKLNLLETTVLGCVTSIQETILKVEKTFYYYN